MNLKDLIFYYQNRFFGKKENSEYLNEIEQIRKEANLDDIEDVDENEKLAS